MRYFKAVQHVRQILAFDKPRIRDVNISVFFGPPGTGKTRAAYLEDKHLFSIPIGKDMWFDNYRGEKTLLIDDFNGELRLVDLLRLLDIYPVQIPIKGSFVYLQATRIIITSNTPIEYWYDYTTRQDSLNALKRRIRNIVEFDTVYLEEISDTLLCSDDINEWIDALESPTEPGERSEN